MCSAVLLCAALKSVLGGLPFFSSVLTLEIQILVAVPGAERFWWEALAVGQVHYGELAHGQGLLE